MKRLKGWVTVGLVSIVANTAWRAAGRKYPNGPVGQLQRRLSSNPGGGS